MLDDLLEDLGSQLVLLARLYRREMDSVFRPHGLTDATAFPLRHLARTGRPVVQARLAEELAVEGPTLVRILDQLADAGLVERIPDKSDRRARLIQLTAQGKQLNAALEPALRAMRARLFAGATQAEVEKALRVLDHLQVNLAAIVPSTDEGAPTGAKPATKGSASTPR